MSFRNSEIVRDYLNGRNARLISSDWDISERQVQRILKAHDVIRTQSESYKLAIAQGRMVYYKKPEHLKAKRVTIPLPVRYRVLEQAKGRCTLCGNTVEDGIRLEIDHIDNNPSNNAINNLQVLCNLCNSGKSHV